MRILLDTCVWPGVGDVLRAAGHDVESTAAWPLDPGDEEILAYAAVQGRVLVTLDKDFGELAVLRGLPHAGIVRLVDHRTFEQASICETILGRYATELTDGGIVTAEANRVRIRPGSGEPTD